MTGAADLDTVTVAASEGTAHRGPELPEHVDDEELVPAVEKESLLAPVQQTAVETETEQKPESTCSDPDTPTVCADPDTPAGIEMRLVPESSRPAAFLSRPILTHPNQSRPELNPGGDGVIHFH